MWEPCATSEQAEGEEKLMKKSIIDDLSGGATARSAPIIWAQLLILFVACLTGGTLRADDSSNPTSAIPPFQDGARCAFIGDSITQGGKYRAYIELFYLTRSPNRKMDFYNCGISGDTAEGGVRRHDFDVASKKPSVATIMFGMNDVNRDLYDPTKGPANPQKRADALDKYEKNLRLLIAKLKASGVSIILMTPTPYDDASTMPAANKPGVNNALGECAKRDRTIAGEMGVPLLDLHEPMTNINTSLQAQDPAASIVGPDRVHPGPPGHLLMTYFFLKTQNVLSKVASFSVRAKDGTVSASDRCVIDQINVSDGSVSFRYQAQSIPYPIDPKATDAEKWAPITQDLNQEVMQVTDLPDGRYDLRIDGAEIEQCSSEELAKGINLAELPATPQRQQTDKLFKLYMEYYNYQQMLRGIAFTECYSLAVNLPYPVTLEQMQALHQHDEGRLKDNPVLLHQAEEQFKKYSEKKQHEREWQSKADELFAELREASKPTPHLFEIRRAQ